jgi:hypothetical protein
MRKAIEKPHTSNIFCMHGRTPLGRLPFDTNKPHAMSSQ